MRKGEIACDKQFLLFSQCFPELYISLFRQSAALCGDGLRGVQLHNLSSTYAFSLDKSTFFVSGQELSPKFPFFPQYCLSFPK